MNEITTKLPYVAGYNIKMAFLIQDLKNLDEIYGETSRHSLMGNCGYQLVLGANDQVTAEAVSKGLGKRTVRYKTESRTIELMGLHRRTKIEQLRERDLLMTQEVRQMPVEGQNPIFADKLRFFATAPLKEMEKFSQSNLPDVPATEFLPQRVVPATMPGYAGEDADTLKSGEQQAEPEERTIRAGRNPLTPNTQAGGRDSQRAASVVAATSPRAGISARPFSSIFDARFVKAARKLETLAKAPAVSGSQRAKANNWARVFDETFLTNWKSLRPRWAEGRVRIPTMGYSPIARHSLQRVNQLPVATRSMAGVDASLAMQSFVAA